MLLLTIYSVAQLLSVIGSVDPGVAELRQLRQQSKDTVIRLSEDKFDRLALKPNRLYTIIIFMTADHLLDKSNLQLRKVRKEFGYAAGAYYKTHPDDLFFCEVEFSESRDLFQRIGVQSLPFVFRLALEAEFSSSGTLNVNPGELMEQKEFRDYPWMAEDFISFVSSRSGFQAGEVDRPSMLKNPIFQLIVLVGLVVGGYVGLKIYYSEWIQNPYIWISACLFVYWFATSGGMYDIIRGVPLMVPTKDGRV